MRVTCETCGGSGCAACNYLGWWEGYVTPGYARRLVDAYLSAPARPSALDRVGLDRLMRRLAGLADEDLVRLAEVYVEGVGWESLEPQYVRLALREELQTRRRFAA